MVRRMVGMRAGKGMRLMAGVLRKEVELLWDKEGEVGEESSSE